MFDHGQDQTSSFLGLCGDTNKLYALSPVLPTMVMGLDQGWAMFTFLNNAMFFTMRCFPILNNVIFRRCLKKNIDLDVFDDV